MSTITAPRSVIDPIKRGADRAMRWHSTGSSYVMLLGAASLLIVFGLMMVLSSSSVSSIADGQSAFAEFYSQGTYAGIGAVLMVIASRIPVPVWKKLAWPAILLAIGLLMVVQFTSLGHAVNGNRNWIKLGSVVIQPAEASKLALVVWCGAILAMKRKLLHQWSHALVPVGPIAGAVLLLVLAGNDLGTGMIIMVLVFGMLFAAGVPLKMFAVAGAAGAALATVMITQSENRMSRFDMWLNGSADAYGANWQAVHGKYALASGGFWGVGLGGSREKWSYLPEPHNDFIFAIIGEELGLPGTVGVLLLIGVIGVACTRIITQHDDLFVKITTAGVFSWIVGQALINIAVVVGMLPVLGIPLPLVSSGGSSLVVTMTAMGMLLAFARSADAATGQLAAVPSTSRTTTPTKPARKKVGSRRTTTTGSTRRAPAGKKTTSQKSTGRKSASRTATGQTRAAKKSPSTGRTPAVKKTTKRPQKKTTKKVATKSSAAPVTGQHRTVPRKTTKKAAPSTGRRPTTRSTKASSATKKRATPTKKSAPHRRKS